MTYFFVSGGDSLWEDFSSWSLICYSPWITFSLCLQVATNLVTLQTCLTSMMGRPITMDQLRQDVGNMVEKITKVITSFRDFRLSMQEYVCLKVVAMLTQDGELGLAVFSTYYSTVVVIQTVPHIYWAAVQCWASKCIEFESGSRILAPFGSGSRVKLSILKDKFKNNFREKQFSVF